MTSELGMSIGSAIAGGNKAKKAARLQAEANVENYVHEDKPFFSTMNIQRNRDEQLKTLNDQPVIITNDPRVQKAYALEKAKVASNILANSGAQESALITEDLKDAAARNYRNRVGESKAQ